MPWVLNTDLGHDLNGRQIEVKFPARAIELAHLFSKPSGPAPGPTRPPIQCGGGLSLRGQSGRGLEGDHSPSTHFETTSPCILMTYRRTTLQLTGTALCKSDTTFLLLHKKKKRNCKSPTAHRPANTCRTSHRLLCPLTVKHNAVYITVTSPFDKY
jgi:hypothetical protein